MSNDLNVFRFKILVIALCIMILLLSAVKLALEDVYSTKGIDYGKLQAEIDEIKKENAQLRQEVLQKESYTYIYSEAKKEGFVEASPLILQ